VADNIPAEIYSIPPSNPLYHDRYVYVYGSTPDEVYVGYTPGYLGAYVWDDTVVFGTGWYYPGWIGLDWYGWPWTWGFGFQFGYFGGGWFLASQRILVVSQRSFHGAGLFRALESALEPRRRRKAPQ